MNRCVVVDFPGVSKNGSTWVFSRYTYGISSGSTSAMILIESVFALDVGAAASRILSRAIMYCGKLGNMACIIDIILCKHETITYSNEISHLIEDFRRCQRYFLLSFGNRVLIDVLLSLNLDLCQ